MTYIRVHDRGRKEITKNIQEHIWRREKWGKYMIVDLQCQDVSRKNITYSEIIKMQLKNGEDKQYAQSVLPKDLRGKNIKQNLV